MFQVFFEDENYELHNVSLVGSMEEVWKSVNSFLEEMNVKVPYYRSWKNEKKMNLLLIIVLTVVSLL